MTLLKKIIFGKQPIESEETSDKVLLAGYFLLMYIGIDIFFIAVNQFNPNAQNGPILWGLAISAGCLFLLRKGWRNSAILIQLVRTNYIAYHFTLIDQDLTGNYFYFIVSGIGAMALYRHEERWKGILFSAVSMALFYLSLLRLDEFKPGNAHFFLVMNFTIAYVMAFVIIYFLNELNYFSQLKVREKNIELEKVNSELDRFVYSVSHDLRAPLSSISGLIQLSEKSTNREETAQYLELMKGRIVRLEQFIRDIINFSRNARAEVMLEEIKLKDLVCEIFDTLKFINGAESVTLQDDLPDSLSISADKTRLQIVLFNLISNAIQYRDPYKPKSYVRFTATIDTNRIQLQIIDNGVGIDPHHHPKIFNMFYRASQNSKGSGLGLYIVKEAMEKLGGTISLHSILGEGSAFTLELPVNRVDQPQKSIA